MVDAINVRDFAPVGTTVGTGNKVADEAAILSAVAAWQGYGGGVGQPVLYFPDGYEYEPVEPIQIETSGPNQTIKGGGQNSQLINVSFRAKHNSAAAHDLTMKGDGTEYGVLLDDGSQLTNGGTGNSLRRGFRMSNVNIFDKTIAGLAQLDSGAKSQIVMCNMEKNAAGIYLNADPGGDLDRGDMQITACNLWHNDYGLLAHKFGGLMATGVKTMNSRLGSVRAEVLDEIATVRNWHLSACSLEGTQFTRTGMIATTTNLGNGKCRIVCTIAHGLAEDMQEIKLFDNSDAATRYIISNVDATSFEVVANFPTSTGGQWWTRNDDLVACAYRRHNRSEVPNVYCINHNCAYFSVGSTQPMVSIVCASKVPAVIVTL